MTNCLKQKYQNTILLFRALFFNNICSVDCYPSISMATHHISLSYTTTYQLALILHRFIINETHVVKCVKLVCSTVQCSITQ